MKNLDSKILFGFLVVMLPVTSIVAGDVTINSSKFKNNNQRHSSTPSNPNVGDFSARFRSGPPQHAEQFGGILGSDTTCGVASIQYTVNCQGATQNSPPSKSLVACIQLRKNTNSKPVSMKLSKGVPSTSFTTDSNDSNQQCINIKMLNQNSGNYTMTVQKNSTCNQDGKSSYSGWAQCFTGNNGTGGLKTTSVTVKTPQISN